MNKFQKFFLFLRNQTWWVAYLIVGAIAFAVGAVFAQTATFKSYGYPGTGALMDGNSRANTTDYTSTQACLDDADRLLSTKRATDTTTPVLKVRCTGATWRVSERVPPVPPVVVTPPVVVVPPVATSPGHGVIPPSGARINAGWSTERIQATGEVAAPSGDGNGAFRTVCGPSHLAFDDPIVWPGQPGRSHLHLFFGNTGTNAFSTAATTAATGNSTCRGGIVNRSSYWIPAIIDMQNNLPVNADESLIYYKTNVYRGVRPEDIKPIPAGLRMLAGDSMNRTPGTLDRPYNWKCHNNGAVSSPHIITDCPVGDQLELEVNFPQCIAVDASGKPLTDSPDGKSHMRYASGGCPASHPYAMPEASFHFLFPIKVAGEARNWRLSSDTYEGQAGLSAHADLVFGWKKEVSDAFSLRCAGRGLDCHAHLIGDGRAIY